MEILQIKSISGQNSQHLVVCKLCLKEVMAEKLQFHSYYCYELIKLSQNIKKEIDQMSLSSSMIIAETCKSKF